MINKTTLGELVTGLIIVAKSVPESLTDANGGELQAYLLQTAHDLTDELNLGQEVNWNATGEPADVVPVNREALAAMVNSIDALNSLAEQTFAAAQDNY